jgi:hypothetical protein
MWADTFSIALALLMSAVWYRRRKDFGWMMSLGFALAIGSNAAFAVSSKSDEMSAICEFPFAIGIALIAMNYWNNYGQKER